MNLNKAKLEAKEAKELCCKFANATGMLKTRRINEGAEGSHLIGGCPLCHTILRKF